MRLHLPLHRWINERLLPLRRQVVRGATGRVVELGIGAGPNLPLYGRDVATLQGVDPAAAGGQAFDPHRRDGGREKRAGDAGTGAAEQHGEEADADHVVALIILRRRERSRVRRVAGQDRERDRSERILDLQPSHVDRRRQPIHHVDQERVAVRDHLRTPPVREHRLGGTDDLPAHGVHNSDVDLGRRAGVAHHRVALKPGLVGRSVDVVVRRGGIRVDLQPVHRKRLNLPFVRPLPR